MTSAFPAGYSTSNMRIAGTAGVYVTAVMEYLSAEVPKLSPSLSLYIYIYYLV